MRILKIIHGYPPLYSAGSEVYSQSICNELCKSHHVLVFTREENPFTPDFSVRAERIHERLEVHFVNMPRAKDGYCHRELDTHFASILNEFKPDVAHIGHLNHLSTGIVDILNETKTPIVFTLHDFWLMCPRGQFLQRNFGGGKTFELCSGQEDSKCASSCYQMLQSDTSGREYWSKWIGNRMDVTKSIIDKVDLFITPSRYLLNRFISDFEVPRNKIMHLDYGFPTDYLLPNEGRTESEMFMFGYIGTHIPAKGINLLIEAFNRLNAEAELSIWGAKDQQSTNALRTMASDNSNIHFMGPYVNQNLANEVFSKVDCIVVPSIWTENSPLVIHEAQACHIPVITADVGGMAEYVHHQINGLLFQHRSAESLHVQMKWALENPDNMKQLGKRGYLYSENGSIPSIVDHSKTLETIYTKIIARP